MTLVVGVNAGDFALLAADSRITTAWPDRLRTRVDCCQKVLRVGEATIIGFCGDLVAIAEILTTFSLLHQANPAFVSIERFEASLAAGLREGSMDFHSRLGRPFEVGVMVAGRGNDGRISLVQCRSPQFHLEHIGTHGFTAMGSGEPIVERLARDFVRHMPETISFSADTGTAPDVLAWQIGAFVESHLPESGIDSVARVLHTLCVDAHDVSRIPYNIQTYSRLGNQGVEWEVIVGTRTGERGKWIQYSGRGDEMVLESPLELVSGLDVFRADRTLSSWDT